MKNRFTEFYRYSDDEIQEIWDKCLFVFDTNVLLDLYRYSKDTSDDFLKKLDEIHKREQIWMPHQVGLEFSEQRIQQIFKSDDSYNSIKKIISTKFKEAQDKIEADHHGNHPTIDLKKINNEMNKCLENINSMIDEDKLNHPNRINDDEILEKLKIIFADNVGEPYTEEQISKITDKGKDRYSKKIPPGYKDENKVAERKYGDLILWFQIINRAKELGKPIVFVTRDQKEDWWWIESGKTIGPRYELKREMQEEAKVKFHMYNSDQFLKYASSYFGEKVKPASITEVERIGTIQNYTYKDEHDNEIIAPYFSNEFDNLVKYQDNIIDFGTQTSLNQYYNNLIKLIRYPNVDVQTNEILSKLDNLYIELQTSKNIESIASNAFSLYFSRLRDFIKSILSHKVKDINQIDSLLIMQKSFHSNIINLYDRGEISKDTFNLLVDTLISTIEFCQTTVLGEHQDLLKYYLEMIMPFYYQLLKSKEK